MTSEDMSRKVCRCEPSGVGIGLFSGRSGARPVRGVRLATESDFDGFGVETLRQEAVEFLEHRWWQIDVVDAAGLFVVKIGVRTQIWAISRGPAFKVHRPHQVTLDQR